MLILQKRSLKVLLIKKRNGKVRKSFFYYICMTNKNNKILDHVSKKRNGSSCLKLSDLIR